MPRDILVYASDQGNADAVRSVLLEDYPRVRTAHGAVDAAACFSQSAPHVVVLSFPTPTAAECAYLGIICSARDAALSPHSTLALCRLQDAPAFYKLCRDGVFDDYLVDKPMYDPHRLRLSVARLIEQREQRELERNRTQRMGSELQGVEQRIRSTAEQADEARAAVVERGRRLGEQLVTALARLPAEMRSAAGDPAGDLGLAVDRYCNEALSPGLQEFTHHMHQQIGEVRRSIDEPLHTICSLGAACLDTDNSRARTVMVVDDMESFRGMVRDMLNDMAVRTMEAASGPAALTIMHRDPPQLVLLDVDMPGMDGLQVVDEMHRSDRLRQIPIILLTGLGTRDIVIQARQCGVADFLVKPIRKETLREKIGRLLPAREPAER